MTNLGNLPDDEVMAQARKWRVQALLGVAHAAALAREHEAELRRRFRAATTISDSLEDKPEQARPFWLVW